jgi:RNA polymerase sigma factor (sigma-70 family)
MILYAIMGDKCYPKRSPFLDQAASDVDLGNSGEFAALLKDAAAGDAQAQTLICEQYAPKVQIVARVLLGPALRPHFDSMDMVQSVHRSLLIGLREGKFDISSPQKLVALATTIVRRKVARKWRTSRRQIRFDHDDPSQSIAATLSALSSGDTDPAKTAEFQDQMDTLCKNLSDVERQMLELRLQGFTSEEVGERIGIHAVALRVRWTRLRKRLIDAGVVADWL